MFSECDFYNSACSVNVTFTKQLCNV